VAVLWVAITALGEWWAATADLQEVQASREAVIVDAAFDLLMVLGIPVFAFVVAMLLTSAFFDRADASTREDGPPVRSNKRLIWPWVTISTALAVFVIFNPGLKGLAELAEEPESEMTIEVTAEQWEWTYNYLDEGVTLVDPDEMVVPVDTRLLLEITSIDVLHAFWVPAWRVKADAVPGLITEILVTPTLEGVFAEDDSFRVQCAELCGTGHARMRTIVRVVSAEAFDVWVSEQTG
jgi:cytochrome c oxidase subunit 2